MSALRDIAGALLVLGGIALMAVSLWRAIDARLARRHHQRVDEVKRRLALRRWLDAEDEELRDALDYAARRTRLRQAIDAKHEVN